MPVECCTTKCKNDAKKRVRLCGEEKYLYYCIPCFENLKTKVERCVMCNEASVEPGRCLLNITGLRPKEVDKVNFSKLITSARIYRRQRGQ